MRFTLFTVVLFVSCCISVKAYRIECNFFGLDKSNIQLARYEGKKLFNVIETETDHNGIVILEGDGNLPCGLYVFVLPGDVSFELFIPPDNQVFQLFAHYPEMPQSLMVKGNHTVSQFIAYQKSFIALSRKQNAVRMRLLDHFRDRDSLIFLRSENRRLEREREQTENTYIEQNRTNPFGQYVYWSQRLQAPLFKKDHVDTVRNALADLSVPGECLVNTPLFEVFIDAFYNTNLKFFYRDQQEVIDLLMDKFSAHDQRYRFALTYLYNAYNNPKNPEQEAVFFHLARKYYLDQSPRWVNQSLIDELQQLLESENRVLLGSPFPRLHRTVDRSLPNLGKLNHPEIWLAIVNNDCESCFDALKKLEQNYRGDGKQAVYVLDLGDKITTNKLSVFPNKWKISNHFKRSDKIMNRLDLRRVPRIYVLDRQQIVTAKGNTYHEVQAQLQKYEERNE